jgi:hypothetical protein
MRPEAGLNTFWQRRMAMLATLNKSSGRISRWLRIVLVAGALVVLAVPLVYLSRADGAHDEPPKTEYLPVPSASETRILAALEEPTKLEFHETPLGTVASFLSDKHTIPVQLDSRALEDVGISNDTPLNCDAENIKLRSGLRLLLRDMDLTYLIQDEVLLITTKDKAEGPDGMITRTYPVGDLVGPSGDFDTLVDVITSAVWGTTWEEVGGPGVISEMPAAKSVVISQSREVHEEVLELLRALRAARKAN